MSYSIFVQVPGTEKGSVAHLSFDFRQQADVMWDYLAEELPLDLDLWADYPNGWLS